MIPGKSPPPKKRFCSAKSFQQGIHQRWRLYVKFCPDQFRFANSFQKSWLQTITTYAEDYAQASVHNTVVDQNVIPPAGHQHVTTNVHDIVCLLCPRWNDIMYYMALLLRETVLLTTQHLQKYASQKQLSEAQSKHIDTIGICEWNVLTHRTWSKSNWMFLAVRSSAPKISYRWRKKDHAKILTLLIK